MNYILFDDSSRNNLLPLTLVRPIADIRIGILTIREKWEKYLGEKTSTITESYLAKKFPIKEGKQNILINGSVCPTPEMVKAVKNLKINETLNTEDYIIAMNVGEDISGEPNFDAEYSHDFNEEHIKLMYTYDVFSNNDKAIRDDFILLTKGRKSAKLSDSNNVIGLENIFVEEGATVEFATLNANTGPIYIGKDSEIMENSVIRGPFALCENAVVKMAAKIYGATTVGPYSKVGGELNNTVIFAHSNKAHDGFLGNSVIAEWCNLGSDTNTSNLKNTYEPVRLWNYPQSSFVSTGLTFCGLIMGDHSKCGINTMFNTGTVVGVNCNIFGSGFQRNYIPSFRWGGTGRQSNYQIDKAFEVAKIVYGRRGKEFDQMEQDLLQSVFDLTIGNKSY
ncbi:MULTISPECIES: GlmU family protein [unclassified Lentimicrobium]|uniref:GlmU family protein n=1 Tax=unclassified Lentimicrobium TaxID=2677434 RepID=UPI0015542E7C|nr:MULTISPECIES: GlmU family protein [unclassified Lentimicrobium]NPD44984.1 glucose-1-phosphate thymidylyltransferase [Lentimicrobium sp. S6]NPD83490.1 glucose-1-phosphate thymidylyltransferase [Lentimicrobium sp. L6]